VTPDLDIERRLALAYVPADRRPSLETLWRLDVTLGQVVATGSDRMISRIRLAWWREALERLDRERPPAEPLLEAASALILPQGVTGAELAGLADGWEVLLEPVALEAKELHAYGAGRGGRLFSIGARLLGGEADGIAEAGARWALADLARRSSRPEEAAAALAAGQRQASVRWPRALRPLGMLAALADRDIGRGAPEPAGSPARILRMVRHRLTGR